MYKRLYRSSTDEVIAGVCGGLGQYFETDPALVRVFTVILFFASWGTALAAYVVAWVIIPSEDCVPSPARVGAEEQNSAPLQTPITPLRTSAWYGLLPGMMLVALGVLIVVHDRFFWFGFGDIWPILLIAAGAGLIVFRGLRSSRCTYDIHRPAAEAGSNGAAHNGGNGGLVS